MITGCFEPLLPYLLGVQNVSSPSGMTRSETPWSDCFSSSLCNALFTSSEKLYFAIRKPQAVTVPSPAAASSACTLHTTGMWFLQRRAVIDPAFRPILTTPYQACLVVAGGYCHTIFS